MSALRVFNCGMETICILVCIILIVELVMSRRRRESDKWYLHGLVANIFMILGDMADWIWSGTPGMLPRVMNTVGSAVYFAASGLLLACYLVYVYLYMRKKAYIPLWTVRVCMIDTLVQVILACLTPFFGLIFTINESNAYVRSRFYFISPMIGAVTFVICLYMVILGWRKLSTRERVYFSLYLWLPFIAFLIHAVQYGFALLSVATTVVFLLIISLIQTETDDQLNNVEREFTDQIIIALSNAVEAKDRYTNGHSRRVARYSKEIVRRMGFGEAEQRNVYFAALLHDVGKIRVLDSIINKPGRLNDDEYESMKLHTIAGHYILKEISAVSDFAIGARWHHERYDGKGYPNGLSGTDIPLIARVIGVADAYDAMTSNRSYRDTLSQEYVRDQLQKGSGTQFDPEIAQIMLDIIDGDPDYLLRQKVMQRKKRILVVDRDVSLLAQVKSILADEGNYELSTAHDPNEGLKILSAREYDVVLLGTEPGDFDALQVMYEIREMKPYQDIIIMTNDRGVEMIVQAEKMQISEYLTKPLIPHQLREILWNVLRNSAD